MGLDLSCVVLDLDNVLLPYGPTVAEIGELTETLVGVLADMPAEGLLLVATNSPTVRQDVASLVTEAGATLLAQARKPSPRRITRAIDCAPTVVVGDQPLTDGLLAWRLRVPFVHVQGCSASEPLWPSLMRFVGNVVRLVVKDE